ncbi:MAG: hypothetical protein MUP16_03865, partial [Sedimentisphaerales bacterium]|nr:hypothetical protein [Sedimentisphaerales bacterium]
ENKGKINLCTYALISCALIVAGCARQQQYPTIENIQVPDANKAEAMQIAEDVLAKMYFTIEKADVETGLITTKPLRGAQFFELWRSDNVGAFNTAEANLHAIRRTVQLRISQQSEGLCIDCDVLVHRLNLPQHQAVTASQAYQIFSKSSLSTQRLILSPEQKRHMEWVDLGKDTKLATEILKRISSILDARHSALDNKYRVSSIE